MINEKLLLEISKRKLLANSEIKRKHRASTQVRTRPPRVTELGDTGLEFIEGNFKSYPSTENKRHLCFVIYDNNKNVKEIKEVYCGCKDFGYVYLRAMEKKKLLDTKHITKKYYDHTHFFPTRRLPYIKNPRLITGLCKHLIAMMDYLD
jgi:hypothetical protein